MNLHTATEIANRFGFVLPTRKTVDAIYDQSGCHFTPQPLPSGPQMTSTEYYRMHNALIDKQSQVLGFPLGALVSGHKKDVVLSNRLITHPGQIAIYGWHRAKGAPIQPLSTVHGAGYADYSHGISIDREDGDDRWETAIGFRDSSRSKTGRAAQRRRANPAVACVWRCVSYFFSVLQQRKLK